MTKEKSLLVISSKRNLCSININEYKQIKVTSRVLYKAIDFKDMVNTLVNSLVSHKIVSTENKGLEDPALSLFLTLILRSLDPEFNNYRFTEWVFPFDFYEKKELWGYYIYESVHDSKSKILVKFCEDNDLFNTDICPDQNTLDNISNDIFVLPAFVFILLKEQKDYDFQLFEDFRRNLKNINFKNITQYRTTYQEEYNVNELKNRENLIEAMRGIKNHLALKGKTFNLNAASELIPKVGRSTLYEWLEKAGLEYISETKTIIDKKSKQKIL